MGKLGINFVVIVMLVLVVVFAWRSKRRGVWVQTGRCYACGAAPSSTDKHGRICTDCMQTRVIRFWLAGTMALAAAGVATWVYWPA
jgi:ABC-type xylose transport system permease subunit